MRTEEGRAPYQEKPGPRPSQDSERLYTQNHRKSTLCDCEFTGRTLIVLVAFAAWLGAIIGAIVLIGYGVILGIRAMSGIDSETLQFFGGAIITVFVVGIAWLAIRED